MKTEEYNKGVSFRVPDASYAALCRSIEGLPGLVFTKRRRFFWSGEDVSAEFTFRGQTFTISTDEWDDALWVMTKDSQRHFEQMQELRDAVEAGSPEVGSLASLWRRLLTIIVLGAAAVAAEVLFLRTRQQESQATADTSAPSVLLSDVDSTKTAKPGRAAPLQPETRDFSASNAVSILLGQETDEDGIKHLADEPDGRTTIETLDGVPCRYHNRKPDNKRFGYLYFAIHPDFKRDELKTAAIEIEYRVPSTSYIRLQYDGVEGDTHQRFKPVLPIGGEVTPGTGTRYSPIRASNQWQTATFQVTDGVFMNSQNGGADFRLEILSPEIYVRRVSVSRLAVKPPAPQPNP
jgi:hypothetical protein